VQAPVDRKPNSERKNKSLIGLEIMSTCHLARAAAAGRMTFGMLAFAAEAYSDQLSERMRDTRRAEARQGRHVGPVPVGYIRGSDGK